MNIKEMMQQLLAKMDANREERKAERNASLEQMKADGIAHRECRKQMRARTDDDRERDISRD
jgi:hypothetical protein